MSLEVILAAIVAALKFPGEMTAFLKVLRETPDEKRADITAALQKQLDSFEETGRPS